MIDVNQKIVALNDHCFFVLGVMNCPPMQNVNKLKIVVAMLRGGRVVVAAFQKQAVLQNTFCAVFHVRHAVPPYSKQNINSKITILTNSDTVDIIIIIRSICEMQVFVRKKINFSIILCDLTAMKRYTGEFLGCMLPSCLKNEL